MVYKITELQGFTHQIGHLVSQMDYARKTTLDAVKGLTVEELDFLPSEESNSIGALLLHIAAIKKGFRLRFLMVELQMNKRWLNGETHTVLA
jgi:uncharacterized damage-inducible protein DinB